MHRKQITAYSGRGTQPKSSRTPTVAELAKRMSELLRLRDQVERTERGRHPAATASKRGVARPTLPK
jgi:hypothetical protein